MRELLNSKFVGSVVYRRNCVLAFICFDLESQEEAGEPEPEQQYIHIAHTPKMLGSTRVIVVSITVENNKKYIKISGRGMKGVRNSLMG